MDEAIRVQPLQGDNPFRRGTQVGVSCTWGCKDPPTCCAHENGLEGAKVKQMLGGDV